MSTWMILRWTGDTNVERVGDVAAAKVKHGMARHARSPGGLAYSCGYPVTALNEAVSPADHARLPATLQGWLSETRKKLP
jgi:hypothetical protein